MIYLLKKSGVAMAEALIAIAMISIAAVVVGGIVQNSVSTTQISQEYLLAQNLATEALEGVKNIRDTNWLLEPTEEECWLRFDVDLDCNPANYVEPEVSYVFQALGERFVLEQANSDLDLRDYNVAMESFRMDIEDVNGRANYVFAEKNPDDEESTFYRSVRFLPELDSEQADFEVTVQWRSGGKLREIIRRTTLFNYL